MSKHTLIQKFLPSVVLAIVLMLASYVVTNVPPGRLTLALSAFALLIIWLTALARLNDIDSPGAVWHTRRLGLLLVVVASVALPVGWVSGAHPAPGWGEVAMMLGFAFTWLTTPNMEPWWKYIAGELTGDERREPGDRRQQVRRAEDREKLS